MAKLIKRFERRVGRFMRKWADWIDGHGAPRSTGYTFTFETGKGLVIREDGRGCRLWYYGMDDYKKAHAESDSAKADAEFKASLIQFRAAERIGWTDMSTANRPNGLDTWDF